MFIAKVLIITCILFLSWMYQDSLHLSSDGCCWVHWIRLMGVVGFIGLGYYI